MLRLRAERVGLAGSVRSDEEESEVSTMNERVRRWSAPTKRIVATVLVVLLALVIYRFRQVLPPLFIAFLIAFILDPIVDFLTARLHLSRTLATTLVFLAIIIAGLGAVVIAPVTIFPAVSFREAVLTVEDSIFDVLTDIGSFLSQPVQVWGYTLDLSPLYQELNTLLRSFVGSVARGTLNVVFGVASGVLWLIVILITAFYLVKDADRIIAKLDSMPPAEYREDFIRLRQEITQVWHAFLRGQLLMCATIAVMTIAAGTAVGLPYAVVLGIIAGVMEFVPNLGPAIALVPAVLLALFKGSNFLPLSNFWFAVLVTGLYVLIQQIESNLLVPRVMGHSLNLHPLVVLIGVIIGGNLAGILGMLLAAPVLATLRVVGRYVFCRLYDLDPFAEPAEGPPRAAKAQRSAEMVRALESFIRRKLGRDVSIRPAGPEDRPAVEALCAQIDQNDYLPLIWESWLNDPEGLFVVAESKESGAPATVVGTAKLSRLAEHEWWLQGLRVAPAYRKRGIARRLQEHLIAQARKMRRDATIRFATHSLNEPVHRLAARHGFRRVAVYKRYRADAAPSTDVPALSKLTAADIPTAWTLVSSSSRYRTSGGLYEDVWTWRNLTCERLALHIAKGRVWGLNVGGELAALAILCDIEPGEPLCIGLGDGRDEALSLLFLGLRGLAASIGCREVEFRPLDEPVLIAAVEAAGYQVSKERDIWIFELAPQ
ncbi:MAG: AI-2E family transporter [Anaerolineae bacterium]|nr:AI-2E family transporter [Anaerolineae bacterium]